VKIIVDTNIIFSAILNTNGTIGDLLFNSKDIFEFYSCNYMRHEIEKHSKKLKSISKLSDKQLEEAWSKIIERISFINEELIPEKIWISSDILAKDIDAQDVDFIALAKYLKGRLWTGDKELYNGLKKKDFNLVVNSSELAQLRKAGQ
jgi:predicted nucleic acid-binding protein